MGTQCTTDTRARARAAGVLQAIARVWPRLLYDSRTMAETTFFLLIYSKQIKARLVVLNAETKVRKKIEKRENDTREGGGGGG